MGYNFFTDNEFKQMLWYTNLLGLLV